MAYSLSQAGTKEAMTAAVNAITAGTSPGESTQLAAVKTLVTSQIATITAPKVLVSIAGNYDVDGSRINITIQPVSLGPNGEILSIP